MLVNVSRDLYQRLFTNKKSEQKKHECERSPNGAKSRPKCNNKSTFGKGYEKGAKTGAPSNMKCSILGAIFHQQVDKQIDAKSMLDKLRKKDVK